MEEKDIKEQTTEETVNEPAVEEEVTAPAEELLAEEDDDPIEAENVNDVEPIVAEDTPESAEEAPVAEAAPKKRRKLAKWKIALICVGGFIALLGIALGLFFLIGSLNAHPREAKNVEFHNTAPSYAVSYDATELALINNAMKADASEDTIKEAIAMIYNKANYNKINNTPSAITVLRGEGSAGIEIAGQKPSGSMIVRGIKAQAGTEYYYQKAAPIMKCSIPALQSMLEDALNQQERAYSDGVSDFRATGTLKGDAAKISDEDDIETVTIPFVKVGVPKKSNISSMTKTKFYKKCNFREDPREITNFLITKDTIVLKELKDGEKYIEYDEEGGYYICRFSLDIENEECVGYSISYLRESANSDDLAYGKFDVVLEVWENGYLKMMHDDERWEGTVKLGGTTTSSESWYESIVFYDFSDELFTEEDAAAYEGTDWVEKLIAHYKEELDNAPKN